MSHPEDRSAKDVFRSQTEGRRVSDLLGLEDCGGMFWIDFLQS